MTIKRKTVSSHKARLFLSRILDDVMKGAEFVITRHGTPVARIIPHVTGCGSSRIEALEKLEKIRHSVKSRVGIRQYINEGKK